MTLMAVIAALGVAAVLCLPGQEGIDRAQERAAA
jgi:hypothetical protein